MHQEAEHICNCDTCPSLLGIVTRRVQEPVRAGKILAGVREKQVKAATFPIVGNPSIDESRVILEQAAQQLLNAARGLAIHLFSQEAFDELLGLRICRQCGEGTIHFVQQMGEKCLIVDGKRIERDADRQPVTRAVKQRRVASLQCSGVG